MQTATGRFQSGSGIQASRHQLVALGGVLRAWPCRLIAVALGQDDSREAQAPQDLTMHDYTALIMATGA